jgi:hypothetical protein
MNTEESKLEAQQEQLDIPVVIWRCNEDITNLYGETIFTKGLVYEQIKPNEYPMMMINNKTDESEVSNLVDYFTSI